MKPATNLAGRTFGRLNVIARAGSTEGKSRRPLWRCRCACGGECVVLGASLVVGRTRSCGCLRAEVARRTVDAARTRALPASDLTGRAFGRLKVIARAGSTEGSARRPLWRCRCVCGRKSVVPASALVAGNTRSCGCLQAELARELARGLIDAARAQRQHRSVTDGGATDVTADEDRDQASQSATV
jgi:hypothetical protein